MIDKSPAGRAGQPVDNDEPESAAAKLFDIRVLIGGLFTVYGVMLTIAGFLTTDAQRHKAGNININLWLGLGMLVLGAVFLAWQRLSPLRHESPTTDSSADGHGRGDARRGH
jgi:hypothetical protein